MQRNVLCRKRFKCFLQYSFVYRNVFSKIKSIFLSQSITISGMNLSVTHKFFWLYQLKLYLLIAEPYSSLSLSLILLFNTFQSVTDFVPIEHVVLSMSRLSLFMSRKLFGGQKIKKFSLIHYTNYLCMSKRQKYSWITQFALMHRFSGHWNLHWPEHQVKSRPVIKIFLYTKY